MRPIMARAASVSSWRRRTSSTSVWGTMDRAFSRDSALLVCSDSIFSTAGSSRVRMDLSNSSLMFFLHKTNRGRMAAAP